MIENEFKLLISEDEFNNIENKLNELYKELCPVYKTHINYYYDTNDFYLNNNNTTLRVRAIGNENIMQLKIVQNVINQTKTSKEYHKRLDCIPKTIESYSLPICIEGCFKLLGSLKTERTSYIISDNIRIDLDKNIYFNKIDFEIEIEYDKDEPLEIICYLTQGIPIYKPIGKYMRFIELFKEKRKVVG